MTVRSLSWKMRYTRTECSSTTSGASNSSPTSLSEHRWPAPARDQQGRGRPSRSREEGGQRVEVGALPCLRAMVLPDKDVGVLDPVLAGEGARRDRRSLALQDEDAFLAVRSDQDGHRVTLLGDERQRRSRQYHAAGPRGNVIDPGGHHESGGGLGTQAREDMDGAPAANLPGDLPADRLGI